MNRADIKLRWRIPAVHRRDVLHRLIGFTIQWGLPDRRQRRERPAADKIVQQTPVQKSEKRALARFPMQHWWGSGPTR